MPKAIPYDVIFMDPSQGHSNPVPTPHDIDGTEQVLKEFSGRRIVKVQQQFVVKYGVGVLPMEAENMLFVAKSTTVPVPRVYAVYQSKDQQHTITYIVMEYIDGKSLLDLWSGSDDSKKSSIAKKLRKHFDQLRQLPHPSYFGNINGGPPLDYIFNGSLSVSGSFKTEDEVTDCIIRVYFLEGGERMSHKGRYYQRFLPDILRGNGNPTFTHGDFQRNNIMVQPNGRVVIIDWEFAGWYPSYWEYSMAITAFGSWPDDWHHYLCMILDPYPNQAIWFPTLRTEFWC